LLAIIPGINAEIERNGIRCPARMDENRAPDWRGEVQPTLRLDGRSENPLTEAHFGEVRFESAESHITYSNGLAPARSYCHPAGRTHPGLARFRTTAPELLLRIDSTIDPMSLRPLFETNQLRGLDLVRLTEPPSSLPRFGALARSERTTIKGQVALTNFSVAVNPSAAPNHPAIRQPLLAAHWPARSVRRSARQRGQSRHRFNAQKIYITTAWHRRSVGSSRARSGPRVARIMEPYRSTSRRPPCAGHHPMGGKEDADLYFRSRASVPLVEVFTLPHIDGDVHWIGHR